MVDILIKVSWHSKEGGWSVVDSEGCCKGILGLEGLNLKLRHGSFFFKSLLENAKFSVFHVPGSFLTSLFVSHYWKILSSIFIYFSLRRLIFKIFGLWDSKGFLC